MTLNVVSWLGVLSIDVPLFVSLILLFILLLLHLAISNFKYGILYIKGVFTTSLNFTCHHSYKLNLFLQIYFLLQLKSYMYCCSSCVDDYGYCSMGHFKVDYSNVSLRNVSSTIRNVLSYISFL